MASTYSSFLQSPNAALLASDASINYITTTTVINEPEAILKHIQAQLKQVTKKEEKVLNAIEGPDSLFLETQTTLQFNNGGGAYLPSMDENLLDEKLVTFPLLHVVNFDADHKIKQIRLHWDQGTLLKQVEAIGRTGRNWPIRDGQAQVDAITKSLKSSGIDPNAKQPLGSRNPNEVVITQHGTKDSVSATRDPHASLALFAPRDPNEHAPGAYQGSKVAPRASAKPAPRDYNELFAGQESQATDIGSKVRSPSPSKPDGVMAKSGAGKHYTGNRLFDDSEQSGTPRSPERKKVFNQKYQHFTFGDGEDAAQNSRPSTHGAKGGAQTFSFEDFATPPKYQSKARPDDELHWGAEDPPSPPKRPIVHAARKDADSHFQFTDESSPAVDRPTSGQRPAGTNLYHDPTVDDEDEPTKKANTTSTNNNRRGDDFVSHHSMTDSQAQNENAPPNSRTTRNDMNQNWSFDTPPTEKDGYNNHAGDGMGGRKFENRIWGTAEADKKIYKTAGDSMGGRAGQARTWGFGDDSDPGESVADMKFRTRGRRTQAQAGASDF